MVGVCGLAHIAGIERVLTSPAEPFGFSVVKRNCPVPAVAPARRKAAPATVRARAPAPVAAAGAAAGAGAGAGVGTLLRSLCVLSASLNAGHD